MTERTALYPGTFDPITLGHLDVIQTSASIFDKVVIGLLINPSKSPRFDEQERKEMIEETIAKLGIINVKVKAFKGLTVELARQEKAVAIIRGLRLTTEYEQELNIIFNNQVLAPDIISILIPPRQNHIHISSSVVRELLNFGHPSLSDYVPQSVLNRIKLWNICCRLSHNLPDPEPVRVFYKTLIQCYQGRPYHNLNHIVGCLNELEEVRTQLKTPEAVEMALLFHDAVYDTHAKDNEEKSAELSKKIIKSLFLADAFGEEVARLILATKHNVPPTDVDAQFIVDIDLAPLGYSEEEFRKNTEKIRKEYSWVSDEQFREGRAKFMSSILARPIIYQTLFFREKYEAQARRNIIHYMGETK